MGFISTVFWPTIAVILSLTVYSFLWKDNFLYKVAEHLFIGVTVGYTIGSAWNQIIIPKLVEPVIRNFSDGKYLLAFWLIIGGVLGMFYFSRFSEKTSWLSRYPIAITVGFYAGYSIVPIWISYVSKQFHATILNPAGEPMLNFKLFNVFFSNPTYANLLKALNGPLIVIGVIIVLIYFFFSFKNDNFIIKTSRTPALVYLMLGFGGAFGYTFMARISLFIGRMNFIFSDWIGLIKNSL
ncbi:MAG: hypothetical protein FXF47_09190 [Candidatus Mcinerneyibacterium aminivorans]|jgi:hypothetical protein|uniref:Uncharacterized protein n=1 Tax=Candidatus Mcinerneyibacterium aminivorans TaxID=2703815 RepID=A0A5D0MBR0_9BACT|nr:MAG: hypothetical protein FXF47_09190 [Candidatus Mcinerneyibacterium aminivorans]